ncbi:hypothetical protein R70006_06203 [Paraburkholderia domus]|uniref:hypothetical protein n=1 Tax=Paraburkholderia domus TaxID=2793075 RepID=UPI001912A2A7|nr:hypothetical protein [Paraburkholderia domus]MBK5052835.1 hypothetical protein [Burkholderia sp. R-70006]CAE6821158.1 hypothetical protein R70006_06203 [Paraburkholderia domus]
MKKMFRTAVLACACASMSVSAMAADPAEKFLGNWRSPQVLDTWLKISETPKGLFVSEVHQNFFGGARVESKPATVSGDKLEVGTVAYHLDEVSGYLIYFMGPAGNVAFVRDPS